MEIENSECAKYKSDERSLISFAVKCAIEDKYQGIIIHMV